MNLPSYFGTHAPWLLLDGFPPTMHLMCWAILCAAIVKCSRQTLRPEARPVAAAVQVTSYKRAAFLLLAIGAGVGFMPSLSLLAATGDVWSVNRVEPHSDVDRSLSIHIPLAVVAAVALTMQFWSGGVATRMRLHRVVGWVAVAALVIGVSIAAGWVWTYFNDFVDGWTGGRARAGYYTVALGTGVAVNAVMLVIRARSHDFRRHLDHALMTVFWMLDPGVHRACMWGMRMVDWDCWAPENTAGLGIALAKLPANVLLIAWGLAIAARTGRWNAILLANVFGQISLFCFTSFGLMQRSFGTAPAAAMITVTLSLGVCLLLTAYRGHARKSSQESHVHV